MFQKAPGPHEPIGMAHFRLAGICITYLSLDDVVSTMENGSRNGLASLLFLNYATNSWITHFSKCSYSDGPFEGLLSLLPRPSTIFLDTWVQASLLLDLPIIHALGTSIIHILALHSIIKPLEYIIKCSDTLLGEIDQVDDEGRTPLSLAAESGNHHIVKLLLTTGMVYVNTMDTFFYKTPLNYAAENGHTSTAQLLISIGKADVNMTDVYSMTPLMWAADGGHYGVAKLLIEADGIEINARHEYGNTALLFAAKAGHEGIVRLLLATKRVDVDAKNSLGRTALGLARQNRHESVVSALMPIQEQALELLLSRVQETRELG
jgi:hypothetical protein